MPRNKRTSYTKVILQALLIQFGLALLVCAGTLFVFFYSQRLYWDHEPINPLLPTVASLFLGMGILNLIPRWITLRCPHCGKKALHYSTWSDLRFWCDACKKEKQTWIRMG